MRAVAIGSALLAAGALGAVQFASMAVYGDLAQPPAVPATLDARLGLALGGPLATPAVPAPLRIAYARALLHRGQAGAAAAIVAALPDGVEAADLRGQLLEGRSDAAGALAAYARARDFERAQRLIDRREADGQLARAAQLEAELVAVLAGDADAGVRARALWRLGQMSQERAARGGSAAAAAAQWSLRCYERALLLAPNEETYLLAAGQQALTVGDTAAAARYYQRALDAVPNSADARAGLERARS